jgi:prepilin peptidase dependent protein B
MNKQSGFTLIELMISLLIGLIIVAATISIYIATVKGSSDTIKSARLNHDLESVMTLMVNDIRRAGYWGGAGVTSNAKSNPFTHTATANIQLPSNSCILYTYDANGSGALTPTNLADDIDANEYYGFKLGGATIRMRLSGSTTANCADGNWQENIDGTQISITGLTFATAYKCLNVTTATSYDSACTTLTAAQLPSTHLAVESRGINITLSGQLTHDATVTKALTNLVKVRNDRIFNQP